MSGRIPCLNPRCRRTAPAEKFEDDDTEIVCGKCWRLVPKALRDRYKLLKRRNRFLLRRVEKRIAQGTISQEQVDQLGKHIDRALRENWGEIRAFFVRPEKPQGLESFLEEAPLS